MKSTSAYAEVVSKKDLGISFLTNVEMSIPTSENRPELSCTLPSHPKRLSGYQILRDYKSPQIWEMREWQF